MEDSTVQHQNDNASSAKKPVGVIVASTVGPKEGVEVDAKVTSPPMSLSQQQQSSMSFSAPAKRSSNHTDGNSRDKKSSKSQRLDTDAYIMPSSATTIPQPSAADIEKSRLAKELGTLRCETIFYHVFVGCI